jgi:copper(I)-binding protein
MMTSKEHFMTTLSKIAIAALWLATTSLGAAEAQEFSAGNLMIDHPWSRATPAGAKIAVGYMVIMNHGADPDRLVGGSSSAGPVEVHEMAMKDGVMTMRPVNGGLQIEPGKSVTLAPGGNHLMFTDVKAPLKQGDKLKATLEFAKAGKVEVTFDVQSIGAQSPMPMQMPGHSDHKM